MAVISDGNPYGVKSGLIFSFPVTCERGVWKIVPGLNVESNFRKQKIKDTEKELMEEKRTALDFLGQK